MALRLRRVNRPVSFFVFFFFIALAPTANLFLLIGSAMSERFLYLPAIGLTGVAVGFVGALARRYPQPAVPKVLWAASGVLCLVLGARTYARNFDWHDEATLWTSVTKVNPDDALAHLNLGSAYSKFQAEGPTRFPSIKEPCRFIRATPRRITISGRFFCSRAAPRKRSRSIGLRYVSIRIIPTHTAIWEELCREYRPLYRRRPRNWKQRCAWIQKTRAGEPLWETFSCRRQVEFMKQSGNLKRRQARSRTHRRPLLLGYRIVAGPEPATGCRSRV